jgi:hypothetical protein
MVACSALLDAELITAPQLDRLAGQPGIAIPDPCEPDTDIEPLGALQAAVFGQLVTHKGCNAATAIRACRSLELAVPYPAETAWLAHVVEDYCLVVDGATVAIVHDPRELDAPSGYVVYLRSVVNTIKEAVRGGRRARAE